MVVVLIHGGFWRAQYGLETLQPLAEVCAREGHRVWNIEYPRIGMPSGGWPGTGDAVLAAVDAALVEAGGRPVVLVGHSAGGHLALWVTAERSGGEREAEAGSPALVVSLAGVADLEMAAREGTGEGAAVELLGATPDADPALYAQVSPIRRLPLSIPAVLIHGDADDRVPVAQSRAYAQAASRAGDRCELYELAGVDHFAVIDPKGPAWPIVRARLEGLA